MTNKEYNKYRKFAIIISEGDEYYADEVLHITLIKVLDKLDKNPKFELTDEYVFKSLRNTFLTMMKAENTRTKYEGAFQSNETQDDIEVYIKNDEEIQFKIDLSREHSEGLDSFEKKLYLLHFIHGISQRQISRESGIGLITIHKKLKKIKDNIKQKYEKENRNIKIKN